MIGSKQEPLYSYNYNAFKIATIGLAVVLFLIVIVLFIAFSGPAVIIPILFATVSILFLVIWSKQNTNFILIDSEFFVLHKQVYYYSSVSKINLNKSKDKTTIHLFNGKTLIISHKNFPTDARKPHKIKINQKNKLHKVTSKLVLKAKQNKESSQKKS